MYIEYTWYEYDQGDIWFEPYPIVADEDEGDEDE